MRRSPSSTIRSCATAPSWSSPTSKTWCGPGPRLQHVAAAAARSPLVHCARGAWPHLLRACWAQRRQRQGAGCQRGAGRGRRRAPSPQQSCVTRWRCRSSNTGSGTCRRAAPPPPGPCRLPAAACSLWGIIEAHLAAPKAVLLSPHPLPAVAAKGCTVQGWRWLTRMGAGEPAGVHCHQRGGPVRGTGLAGSSPEVLGGSHLRGRCRAGLSAQGAPAFGGPCARRCSGSASQPFAAAGHRGTAGSEEGGGRRRRAGRRQRVAQRSRVSGVQPPRWCEGAVRRASAAGAAVLRPSSICAVGVQASCPHSGATILASCHRSTTMLFFFCFAG